jgi:regulator of sigma E protease
MYVYIVIKGLREGKVSLSDFAGPLGIMHFATEQAKAGLGTLLLFIAFLSVQLCILNLLPLPALDGGHAILLLIESIRKKPISHKIQSYINIIGFSLLITLLLVVTYNDILRLIFR